VSGGATREAALLRGARLGEYIVAGEIASGGMGVVYLAGREGQRDGGAYAIKVVHDDLVRRFPELGDLLRREAHLAANLHHPHAVGVLEVGEHEARPYAVMPYIEGGTLADLVATGKASPAVIASVMIDALRGLHAAHAVEDERGRPLRLVHRDVCPENVLVGVDGRARIADFGIAVAAAQTLDVGRGSGRGKWAYMSPEQLRGESVDRRADVFSAGVTLYCALTGGDLFQGHAATKTMQNVLHMPVPRPSTVGARPPPAYDSVCMRALERDPQARFSTAEAMAVALADAAEVAGGLPSPEEVGALVREVLGGTLASRRESLASLVQARRTYSPRDLLPLPPPNPRDSAAEILRPEDVANLAAELYDEDDDDPDGPATSVYRPEEHDDVEISFDVAEVTAHDTAPDTALPAFAVGQASGEATVQLAGEELLASGSGSLDANDDASALAVGTPPGGSTAIAPVESLRGPSIMARLAALWRRFWRLFRR
jgi:serine/threonine protein kinase